MPTELDPYSPSAALGPDPNEQVGVESETELIQRAERREAHFDHRVADAVAATTETPAEAAIDAANGLRGHGGRRPVPEDFDGLLTAAGDSGDIVGTAVDEGSVFTLGEDGATKGTLQDGT